LLEFEQGCEITLEANPGTVEHDPFADYLKSGINRLSIGVQSFNQEHLQRLGRIHSSANAIEAIQLAKQAGFERVNVDLMHGLPEQTLEQALLDLKLRLNMVQRISVGINSRLNRIPYFSEHNLSCHRMKPLNRFNYKVSNI
jgi:oxygen-independent coproporphyrinogen-3 oxidase